MGLLVFRKDNQRNFLEKIMKNAIGIDFIELCYNKALLLVCRRFV